MSFARARFILVVIALVAATACSDESTEQGSIDPRAQELVDLAEAMSSGEEEVPYYDCGQYGGCWYCEGGEGNVGGCSTVCYGYSCDSGDSGGGCYEDCSSRA